MYRNNALRNQCGFLLPVALFLIIAIAALAIGVSRLSSQAGASAYREGITIQALYAAESGMQWGMNQVLYPTASRTAATTNCANVADALLPELIFTTIGLACCSVEVSCTSSDDSTGSITFFTLTSEARCGDGELMSERVIQASAYVSD